MPKSEFRRVGEFAGQQCQKQQKDVTKEEQKCCHFRLQYVTKRSRCSVLLDRLIEKDMLPQISSYTKLPVIPDCHLPRITKVLLPHITQKAMFLRSRRIKN